MTDMDKHFQRGASITLIALGVLFMVYGLVSNEEMLWRLLSLVAGTLLSFLGGLKVSLTLPYLEES